MRIARCTALALGLVVLPASGAGLAHPGGEEERLMGKGDRSDVRFGAFPTSNMTFLSQVPISAFGLGGTDANDCWGYVTPLGKEIAIIGLQNGTGFVDITNPSSPQIIGAFPGPTSIWRDIKVIGTMAYAVSEGGNHIQKFNLANADSGVIGNLGFSTYSGTPGSTHNIAANPQSGYLYRCGGGNNIGIRVYGVGVNGAPGSPTNPSQRALQTNLYVHDAQVVTYTDGPYAGREIAFLCSGFGTGGSDTKVRIWDVTNKSNMFEISSVGHPGRRYVHQGWLSEDRRYFYVNDELDEGRSSPTRLHIYNVEDLENPFFVKSWANGTASIDHNLYVRGEFIYASNYRSGLRVFNISDPENPVEVAWIDTYPADDLQGFDGAWSNYPFFPSGNIIISDIQQGLIVVRPDTEILAFSFPEPLSEILSPVGGDELLVDIVPLGLELGPQLPELSFRDEAGVVRTVAGEAVGLGNRYRFVTPAFDCFERLGWWITARAADGRSFSWPGLGPADPARATAATGRSVLFQDDSETDLGYISLGTASDGKWTRGIPVASGLGDPETDADGSGRAWLTDNEAGNSDVDGGEAFLFTPVFDVSEGGTLSYSFWLNDLATSPLSEEDSLRLEYATAENVTEWIPVRTYTIPRNQWREDVIQIGDGGEIPATSGLFLRFVATDGGAPSVVEAGIDAVLIEKFSCDAPVACAADTNADGLLSPADFSAWIAAFNAGAPECDQNGDLACSPADFSAWIANFNAGCG